MAGDTFQVELDPGRSGWERLTVYDRNATEVHSIYLAREHARDLCEWILQKASEIPPDSREGHGP